MSPNADSSMSVLVSERKEIQGLGAFDNPQQQGNSTYFAREEVEDLHKALPFMCTGNTAAGLMDCNSVKKFVISISSSLKAFFASYRYVASCRSCFTTGTAHRVVLGVHDAVIRQTVILRTSAGSSATERGVAA